MAQEARVWRGHMMVPLGGEFAEVWYDCVGGEIDDWGFSSAKFIALPITPEEHERISEEVWREARL